MLAIQVIYMVLAYSVDLSGGICPKGYLGAGGLSLNGSSDCLGGNYKKIDQLLIGEKHIGSGWPEKSFFFQK